MGRGFVFFEAADVSINQALFEMDYLTPDFSRLWAEPFPVPHHAALALAALGLGSLQLLMPKGTFSHRLAGYVWCVLMAGTALTAAFIYGIRIWGIFSPVHLLIPIVLISLWIGIRAARRGDIQRHRRSMSYLFFLALVVTGLFTLLPGRVMHAVLFGGA